MRRHAFFSLSFWGVSVVEFAFMCTKEVGGKVIISFQWQSRSGTINVSYCVSLIFGSRIGN